MKNWGLNKDSIEHGVNSSVNFGGIRRQLFDCKGGLSALKQLLGTYWNRLQPWARAKAFFTWAAAKPCRPHFPPRRRRS